ncbi:MAG: dihydrodipicolinate synthase family protein [Thermodesulfobacteriota bacterium]|nr:dihydrodipicolinate synthase family protein [Thermodesulfobacteriota bacterium]
MSQKAASHRERLSGVFAPITTPFDEEGNLLIEELAANIQKLNGSGLRGYLVLGTNGEFKSLSEAEKRKVMETVIKVSAMDKVVMAGTGRESTHESIIASKEAASMGADFASLIVPSFFPKKMTDQVLLKHFRLISDASPIPVLLYNNPEVAVLTFSTGLIGEISKHPNVVGMKDSSKGNFASYLLAAGSDFNLLAGSATFFLEALFMGGVGGVLSIANFAPEPCCKVYDLWRAGKLEEAKQAQYQLMSLNQKVSGKFGVSGVKAAMDLAGFYGGPPRAPLLPLAPDEKRKLREELIASGFLKE